MGVAGEKTYLNVAYAEKDAAKALGAKWDAAAKKWYVPPNTELAPFAKWQTTDVEQSSGSKVKSSAVKNTVSAKPVATGGGVLTYPADKNFVAYSGDEPPWD